jgi:hypothetical protein
VDQNAHWPAINAIWPALILVSGLFCIVRGVVDLKQRRYVWGGLGLAIGCAILAWPIQTHAVKLELIPSQR